MKVMVVGGSGRIGSQIVRELAEKGHDVVSAAPDSGVDTLTGAGLSDAIEGVHTVVDASASPSFSPKDVLEFFTVSTGNLLAAERVAGVQHHVAVSIVGCDRVPDGAYMRAKVAQEEVIASSTQPFTILRATQFFEFAATIADSATDEDVVRLPPVAMQPIAARDVALAVSRVVAGDPFHGVINIAGPERIRMDDFARAGLARRGDQRAVVADPDARYFGAALTDDSIVPLAGEVVVEYPTRFADWAHTQQTKRAPTRWP